MNEAIALLTAQLMDPFRMGLLAALIFTTIRNAPNTGWFLPLAAGILFVAYIIAMTFPRGDQTLFYTASVGVVANAIIVAVMLALWFGYRKLQK